MICAFVGQLYLTARSAVVGQAERASQSSRILVLALGLPTPFLRWITHYAGPPFSLPLSFPDQYHLSALKSYNLIFRYYISSLKPGKSCLNVLDTIRDPNKACRHSADIPSPIPPPLKVEHRLSGEGPLLGRFPDRGNTLPQLKSGESDSSGTLFHSPSAQQSAASRLAGSVPGNLLAFSTSKPPLYCSRTRQDEG